MRLFFAISIFLFRVVVKKPERESKENKDDYEKNNIYGRHIIFEPKNKKIRPKATLIFH